MYRCRGSILLHVLLLDTSISLGHVMKVSFLRQWGLVATSFLASPAILALSCHDEGCQCGAESERRYNALYECSERKCASIGVPD